MAHTKTVFIVLPCYNEEEGLAELLERFKRVDMMSPHNFHFVVVNDGSTDHSLALAKTFLEELTLEIIDFTKNKGVSEVFNEGFATVLEKAKDGDLVITLDSDNTMNPFVSLDLIDELEDSDIVIASRFVKGGQMVGVGPRIVYSYGASWLMRWRAAIPGVQDYSIFYRGYRIEMLRKLFEAKGNKPIHGKGFACMANLLLQFRDIVPGARFKEIPLVLNYHRKTGRSGISILKTISGYLKLAFPTKE